MHPIKHAVLYGLLVWLVPFVSAFAFYSRDGELTIDIFLFKTIMIIVGSLIGAYLLVRYFRKVEQSYIREGVYVGSLWLVMNWVLDFATLVPMNDMAVSTYFTEIGLRYLTMPIFAIAIGWALQTRTEIP